MAGGLDGLRGLLSSLQLPRDLGQRWGEADAMDVATRPTHHHHEEAATPLTVSTAGAMRWVGLFSPR